MVVNICYPCDCVAKRPGFHVWRSCTLYHNTVSIVWRRSSWNRQLKIKDRMKYHWDTIAEIKPQAFDGGLEKMTYLNLEGNKLTRIFGRCSTGSTPRQASSLGKRYRDARRRCVSRPRKT